MGKSKKMSRSKKEQVSLEYMMVFAFAFLVVAVVLVYIYVTGIHNTTSTNAYCYLTPDMPCQGMYVISNSVSPTNAKAYVIFTNDKGTGIYVKPGSFYFYPSASNTVYSGECFPSNIPQGGIVVCNVTISNLNGGLSAGEQVNPKFNIGYSVCSNNYCNGLSQNAPVFNTTGTGTVYVAQSAPSLYYITIKSNSINVTIDGVNYSRGSKLTVFKGIKYTLFGQVPAGYNFGSWTGTGGVSVASSSAQSTVLSATANGTISGSYLTQTSSSTSTSSTSTSSTSTSSTSTSSTSTSSTSTTSTSSTSTSTIACSLGSLSYSTPGGPYAVTVPIGCSAATVTLTGGAGGGGGAVVSYPMPNKDKCGPDNGLGLVGGGAGGRGGSGASLAGSISVTSGETLYIWVGGGGGDSVTLNPTGTVPYSPAGVNGINGGASGGAGYNYVIISPPPNPNVYCSGGSGGGGGGYSAIGTSSAPSSFIAIASGGGGGGGASIAGDGVIGGSGEQSGANGFSYRTCSGSGGGGATTSSGGSAGSAAYSGSAYAGGQGAYGACGTGDFSQTTAGGGGGGGAGYYGGGGGGSANAGAGGGSTWWSSAFTETSYNPASNPGGRGWTFGVTSSTAPTANNGIVVITWS